MQQPYTAAGSRLPASMPYLSMASCIRERSMRPSSASDFRASTMKWRSTSKNVRSDSRVSERPKPSVPSAMKRRSLMKGRIWSPTIFM